MSGYKRVNYYELCRLCTSTEGTKVHLFKEEGCRRQLPTIIKRCLPLKVEETDLLPKMICSSCIIKLEEIDNFRNSCSEAEKMLQDFRSKLKKSAIEPDGKLQVYVKDSPSHKMLSPKKTHPSDIRTQTTHAIQQAIQTTDTDGERRMITLVPVQNRVNEEARQIPLQCSMPLKINGVTSSVVPVSVENLSSLMQVVPDNEMPRIQKFNVPLPTEMTNVNNASNARYNVTLSSNDSMQKDASNMIQSLQCTVTEDGSINLNKMSIQSTSTASFNTTPVPISLISSSHPTISQNGNVQDLVMEVNITKEEPDIKSACPHCGKLNDPNEICNHCIVRTDSTISQSSVSTSVIQSNPTMYNLDKPSKWIYSEEHGGFKCDICGKPFRKKEHLFQHRKLHSGVRPYVCGSCEKSFSRKEHLFRHTLAHTGEKRHSCNLCGKTFSRKDNLHKHKRTHGITGPYECELCGKSFIVKHYFLMHQANHNTNDNEELPFQCDICKKGFVKEEYLNTHKVRHRVRMNHRITNNSESVIATTNHMDDNSLSTINSVAILSPNMVQQNCSEETIFIPSTFTLTSTAASNTTAATQTPLFTADLISDDQLLENYRHLSSTAVSS